MFFSDSAASIFPSDKTVRTEIEETLISLSLRDWKPEEDDETFPDIPDNSAGHAWRAYRRLVRCGWLEEEQEGYATRVVIPSDVGRLLSALLKISSQRTRLYGGIVQSIYNSIRQVKEQPEEQAAAFALVEACPPSARVFSASALAGVWVARSDEKPQGYSRSQKTAWKFFH